MDLFKNRVSIKNEQPLATRMRPEQLDDVVGQKHIIGSRKMLRRMIEADRLTSLIFYGPPGTGKTSLAKVISKATKSKFTELSALTTGVKEIRSTIEQAKGDLAYYGQKTICFVDEFHRLNKGQQDVFLEGTEHNSLILIGATTENPYFSVNSALLSRASIFRLEPLREEDIVLLLHRALDDKEKGLGNYSVVLDPPALHHLASMANGDARKALNGLELGVLTTEPDEQGIIHISLTEAEQCIQRRAVIYDKSGDSHYDVISAFIKSMRGSAPDATLHYLAKMIDSGEDPEFIARRIIIAASEDVGLAYPSALQVAVAAAQAVKMVGLPEARIILAQAALMVTCCPKSNAAYLGIDEALKDLKSKNTGVVPLHLRDAHYEGAKQLSHGQGYKYPHDYPSNYVHQSYLPKELIGVTYYHPTSNGFEEKIKQLLARRNNENK